MLASELITHALDMWKQKAQASKNYDSQQGALSMLQLGLALVIDRVGDVELNVQWVPPGRPGK